MRVEVWDYKLVKQFRGRVDVPLKRVLDKQSFNERVTDKFRCSLLAMQILAGWMQFQTSGFKALQGITSQALRKCRTCRLL